MKRRIQCKCVWLWAVFCLFFFSLSAQKNYTKSISILSENDSYMLMGKDGYFTNGLTLSYAWTSKDTTKSVINAIEVGQSMYNAKNGSYNEQERIDRPVTAYLYGRYSRTQFAKHHVLNWKLGVGTIGPNALGRQLQESIHSTLGMYKPREWQFQLRNAFAVDLSIIYVPQLFRERSTVNLYPVVASDVGMTFTNMKLGGLLTLGRKSHNEKSALWNAQLNQTDKNASESFFYFEPILTYNVYDATVQGGLFHDDPQAGRLNRLLLTPQLGWQYARHRFSLNLGVHYTGREAKDQIHRQWYGSVRAVYNIK
ncbi:MAG: DUF2219 family protein [Chitinophagaceae bacterium]